MSRGAKRLTKLICLVLVLALAGIGIYQAYFFFLKRAYPVKYEEIVTAQAEKYELEPAFVYAVIRTESGFDPDARSNKDAIGLMQITSETFQWLQSKRGVEEPLPDEALLDPETNISYGVYLLSILKREFGNETAMLSGYNAGMGITATWLEDPEVSADGEHLDEIPYPETQAYVDRVLKSLEMYRKLYGGR